MNQKVPASESAIKEPETLELIIPKPVSYPLGLIPELIPNLEYLSQSARGFHLSYVPSDTYLERFRQAKNDPTRSIPFQTIHKFPLSGNEGLYGWTYRNKDGAIRLREDLAGIRKLEVDIHESIHTPDEYETRALTRWIIDALIPQGERYSTQPPEYKR